jgi:hypothetical protein
MASKPKHVTSTTITRPTAGGGTRTTSRTVTKQGGNTTVAKRITITGPKKASKPKKASTSKGGGGKKAKAPVKWAGPALGGSWISGPNDTPRWQLCGPVAIANHLLLTTGVEASSGDMERLYRAAGGHGDSGAHLERLLAAAASTGLAGCRLAGYAQVAADEAQAGLVLVLALGDVPELHAAVTTEAGLITWGEELAVTDLAADINEAWSLTWHGEQE